MRINIIDNYNMPPMKNIIESNDIIKLFQYRYRCGLCIRDNDQPCFYSGHDHFYSSVKILYGDQLKTLL